LTAVFDRCVTRYGAVAINTPTAVWPLFGRCLASDRPRIYFTAV
jgi:hypothetical protein